MGKKYYTHWVFDHENPSLQNDMVKVCHSYVWDWWTECLVTITQQLGYRLKTYELWLTKFACLPDSNMF